MSDRELRTHQLDKAIIQESLSLSAITEMHDRQIVSTVLILAHQGEIVTLLTCDQNITTSGLVPIFW